jgi:hypothetical protein
VTTPLAIDFMVPNNPETRQVAEIIQAMAGEAGFDIKIRVTEFATSLKEAEEGRYQAYMLAWSGRVDPDGNSYSFYKTKAPQNYAGYSNPEVDAWLDEARTKGTVAERKAVYEKIAEKALSEGGIVTSITGDDHRPHGQARRLQADARRSDPADRRQAEAVRARGAGGLTSQRRGEAWASDLDASVPRQALAAADPDTVFRVGDHIRSAATAPR